MPKKQRQKLDVLQIGGQYTYLDLCRIFNEEAKHGHPKEAQIRKWRMSYDLVAVPRANTYDYILQEVYDDPIEIEETRGRKSEYADAIGEILLLLCYNNKVLPAESTEIQYRNRDQNQTVLQQVVQRAEVQGSDFYEFTASKSQLYRLLGLCQQAFLDVAYQKNPKLITQLEKYPTLFKVFQEEVFGQCSHILNHVRSTMKAKKMLESHDTVEFAYEYWVDPLGNKVPLESWEWKTASTTQALQLMECQRKALAAFGCTTEPDIYKKKLESEYRQKVIELMEKDYNIDIVSYRNSVTFWAAKDVVDQRVGQLLAGKQGDLIKIQQELADAAAAESNQKFIQWIDSRSQYDWNTINTEGFVSEKREKWALSKGYDKAFSPKDAYKWDEILAELYDHDEQMCEYHKIVAKPQKDNPCYCGDTYDLYMSLRNLMRDKYIKLKPGEQCVDVENPRQNGR